MCVRGGEMKGRGERRGWGYRCWCCWCSTNYCAHL